MKNAYSHFGFSAFAFLLCFGNSGCNKDPLNNSIPKIDPPRYLKLNGTWTGIGTSNKSSGTQPPDAFMRFNVVVVNDTTIIVDKNTLYYSASNSSGNTVIFARGYSGYTSQSITLLKYDLSNESIEYSSSSSGGSGATHGGASFSVSTSLYYPNQLIKEYVSKISGTKLFSGEVRRYLGSPTRDTIYGIDVSMVYASIDDSTISFSEDILNFGGLQHLFYKSTNLSTQTVIFQTPHQDYPFSTLTYYYAIDSIVFEQTDLGGMQYVILK